MIENFDDYPYFKRSEFACTHTGECEMQASFMDKLFELRKACNVPFIISSGYRDITHPIEQAKINAGRKPGVHTMGLAADILCSGNKAHLILKNAMIMGFTGIGINQSGNEGRFIHLDTYTEAPRPNVWSY